MQIEQAERQYDLNRVAELQVRKLAAARKGTRAREAALASPTARACSKEEVDEDDIAEVIARWTGIPVSKLLEGEKQKLLHLDEELHRASSGRTKRSTQSPKRSFVRARDSPIRTARSARLFSWPDRRRQDRTRAGAGRILFDDERALIRIDMSEYQERHTVARLIGAPPGYIGYEEGGQLTEAVRRRPY